MQESTLTKLCLAIAILGITILYFISKSTHPPEVLIQDINQKLLDKDIAIQGAIQKIHETPGLFIITLKQNSATIPVIIFKDSNITLSTNIKVTGTITQYNNQLELIAKEVKNV